MQLRCITCLPRVTAKSAIDLDGSRLVHIGFGEWLALEGQSRSAQYDKLESKYTRNPPLFWEVFVDVDPSVVGNVSSPPNIEELAKLIADDLEALVKALHWYTGVSPIHPMRSVSYFDPRNAHNFAHLPGLEQHSSAHGVYRRYGESEKEYATQNDHPNITLSAADSKPLADMFAFVRRTRSVWMAEEFDLASHSLSLSGAPGISWPVQVLLLISAYESLFVPDRTTGLQKWFERRLVCMVASDFEEVSRLAPWFRTAYQLRSDLVHGRPLASVLKRLPVPPPVFVETISRMGVIALCRLIAYRWANKHIGERSDPLWSAIDNAVQSADGFRMLTSFGASALTLSHQWKSQAAAC
jgi:hypothetical protein